MTPETISEIRKILAERMEFAQQMVVTSQKLSTEWTMKAEEDRKYAEEIAAMLAAFDEQFRGR